MVKRAITLYEYFMNVRCNQIILAVTLKMKSLISLSEAASERCPLKKLLLDIRNIERQNV